MGSVCRNLLVIDERDEDSVSFYEWSLCLLNIDRLDIDELLCEDDEYLALEDEEFFTWEKKDLEFDEKLHTL